MPSLRTLAIAATLCTLPAAVLRADSLLADAAEARDGTRLLHLIASHRALDDSQVDGMTALHWACYHDDTESALALIEAGANPSPKNRYNITPISIACANGNTRLVQRLLAQGADPNTTLNGGETLLMTAARVGKIETIKALIAAGADLKATERNGQTALMQASAEGHSDIVRLLVENGADFNHTLKSGYTPFFFAIRQGHQETVRLFLELGADVNAAMEVEKSERKTAKPQTSPLILAMENGHFDLCIELLERGADPNDMRTGLSPLHTLVRVRKPDLGEGAGGEPAPEVTGPINSLELAQALLDKGADINMQTTSGRKAGGARFSTIGVTPFLLACDTADLPYMKFLVERGANHLTPNPDGVTPLMVAAGLGSHAPEEEAGTPEECLLAVKYLVELGADVNTVARNGDTAMHGAAYKNAPQVIEYLAQRGADIQIWNTKNQSGRTPLFIAEGYRPGNFKPDFATIETLESVMLARGVDPSKDARPVQENYAD